MSADEIAQIVKGFEDGCLTLGVCYIIGKVLGS